MVSRRRAPLFELPQNNRQKILDGGLETMRNNEGNETWVSPEVFYGVKNKVTPS